MKNIAEITIKDSPNPVAIMKGWAFLFVFFACLHGNSGKVYAQTTNQIYIAQSALGQDNGADCADAYPVTWFNTAANWAAPPITGKIGPGTMVHICGTISSPLVPTGSGAVGNPITIYFEPNAIMSAPTWPQTSWDLGGAIQLYNNAYIVLDGGLNGIIEATNSNSTSQQSSAGIMLSSVSNVEVRDFTINNMYVRTSSTDIVGGGAGIVIAGGTNVNVSVHNNTISQAEGGIELTYENSLTNHILIYGNTLSGNSNSISVGEANSNCGVNDLQIYDNNITGSGTEWDSPNDTYHHNGIHVFAVASGDSITNLKIYGNYINGNWGTNVTSWIFIEDGGSNQGILSPMIFNNVLYYDGNGNVDDGLIFTRVSNTQIFNNTIVAPGSLAIVVSPDTSSAANIQITNNIIYSSNSWIYDSGTGDYSSSNNLIDQNSGFVNLSGLNFQLTAASPAIGAGSNFSSYFTTDAAGNTRPSSGAWDIGAYEYEGSLGDIYIAQTTAGTANGSSCTNPQSAAFLNNTANWGTGTGQIGPGMTVHLCGIISTAINVLGSGIEGHPITIYFEPSAKMSAPVFPVTSGDGSGAITIQGQNYITINGGMNGIIENTANGTGLANQVDSVGVEAGSSSYLTVENLTIRNLYVRTSSTDESGQYGTGITDTSHDLAPWTFTDFTATNNTISDAGQGIIADYGNVTGIEWSYNTIYNVNWGMALADDGNGATASGIKIHNNHVYSFTNWNDTVSDDYHHNGWYGWAESGGTLTNVNIYDNTFGPGFGNQYQTSAIFDSGQVGNINVYNNLFLSTDGTCPADAMITIGEDNVPSIDHIYNNTFIGTGNCTGIGVGGDANSQFIVENNIASGLATFISFGTDGASFISDYNLGYNLNASEAYDIVPQNSGGTSSFQTLAQWHALGYDLHSLTVNPNLSSTYTLQAGSPAIGAGVNMTSLGITTLDFDAAGTTRPSSGAWDMGAYEYTGPSSGNINYGDVNGDGQVTIYDAELTAQYAVGLPVSNFNAAAAEVDGNSSVDIYDAYLIAEYSVGLITKFPVQGN